MYKSFAWRNPRGLMIPCLMYLFAVKMLPAQPSTWDPIAQQILGAAQETHNLVLTNQARQRVWLLWNDAPPAGIKASLILFDVEFPIAIKVSRQIDGSELNDGLGHLLGPAHA